MARATREKLSPFDKVGLGLAAIGILTAGVELFHDFPYMVGWEDPKDFQPFVFTAVAEMFERMIPPVSSVEGGQIPIPTSVQVTPEGTPLSVGVFPPGTAVVAETGEVITITAAETAADRLPTLTLQPPTATQTETRIPPATEKPFLKPEWFNPPDLDSVGRIAVAGREVPFGVLDPDNPNEFPFPPERNISIGVQNMRENGVKFLFLSAVVVAGENGEVFFRDERGLKFINLAVPMFDGGRLIGWKVAHSPVASLCGDPLIIADADLNTPTVDIYPNHLTRLAGELKLLLGKQVIVEVIEPDSPLGCPASFAYQAGISNNWLKDIRTTEGNIGDVIYMNTE